VESPRNDEGAGSGLRTGANLAKRVAVGVVAVPAIVFLAWVGGWAVVGLASAIVVVGALEFYRMCRARGARPFVRLGVLGGAGLCLAAHWGWTCLGLTLTLLVVLVLAAALFRRAREEALTAASVTLMGLVWIGWLGSHLVLLRELPKSAGMVYTEGAAYLWLALALTWSADTAAYGVGVVWGRHALFPRVSPRKSVEGALGGLAGSLGFAWLARSWFAPFLGPVDVWILGLTVGVAAQAGDFVESMVKREAGVKDASRVIPGHGGILDRFDSLLFCGPLVYVYLRYAVLR